MEPTDDPTSIIDVCRIASGIQLLRDLGAPDVLNTCESFEGSVFSFLELCPKLKSIDLPLSGAPEVPGSSKNRHWWWQIVMPGLPGDAWISPWSAINEEGYSPYASRGFPPHRLHSGNVPM